MKPGPERARPRRPGGDRPLRRVAVDVRRQSDRAGAGPALRPADPRPDRRPRPLFQMAVHRPRRLYRQAHPGARQRAPGGARRPTTSASKSTPSCATASTTRCCSINRSPTSRGANAQLGGMLNSALRRTLSEASITDIVRDKRDQLMADIRDQMIADAKRFGLSVIDVRIKRADLPAENSEAVFRRMQTERQQRAASYRAQGSQQSQQIKAEADRKVTVITATAQQQSAADPRRRRRRAQPHLRGGLRRRSRVLRLLPLDAGLPERLQGGARALISPKSDFFRYFSTPTPARRGAPPLRRPRRRRTDMRDFDAAIGLLLAIEGC